MAFVSCTECMITSFMHQSTSRQTTMSGVLCSHSSDRSFLESSQSEPSENRSSEDDLGKCYNIRRYIRNDISHPQISASRQHTRYWQPFKVTHKQDRRKMIRIRTISKLQPRKKNLNNLMPTAEMFETKIILNPTQQMSTPIVIGGFVPCTWDLKRGFVFGPCAGDFAFGECSCWLWEGEAEESEC